MKQTKIWASWMYVACSSVPTLNKSRSFLGHSVHYSQNWAITWKRLIIEWNRRKFGPRGYTYVVCIFVFLPLNSIIQKRFTVERNWRKFGSWGVYPACIWYLWPWTYQGHLGLFGALFWKKGGNLEMAHCRVKQTNIWALWVYVVCIGVFTLELVKVIWGRAVHFSQTTQTQLIVEQKCVPRGYM